MEVGNNIELGKLARKSATTEQFLNAVAKRIAHMFYAKRCSIYILNTKNSLLTLLGSFGITSELLNYQKTTDKKYLEISTNKGIVGLTFRTGKPLLASNAITHPEFTKFNQLKEEDYSEYLATVLKTHEKKIGLILLQRKKNNRFSNKEMQLLENLGSSIADLVEEASALILLRNEQKKIKTNEKNVKKSIAKKCFSFVFAKREHTSQKNSPTKSQFNYSAESSSINGQATILNQEKKIETILLKQIEEQHASTLTIKDFHKAVKATKKQIEAIQGELSKEMDELARDIFTGHLLILKDQAYIEKIEQKIKENTNVAQAIFQVTKTFIRIFSRSEMTAIQEKVLDLQDISRRLLTNLLDKKDGTIDKVKGKVLITQEIFPSQLMFLATRKVAAVIVGSGINPTSHIALVAHSLTLPLVSLPRNTVNLIKNGDDVLLDFEYGTLHINANATQKSKIVSEATKSYKDKKQKLSLPENWKNGFVNTANGTPIKILANINLPRDMKKVTALHIPIGLYRSEFLFLMRNHFPNEKEQTLYYRKLFANTLNEVVIRTLDIGGDKMFSNNQTENNRISSNPLGLRSIRYLAKQPDIFTTQLRSIFAASHDRSPLKLLLPFISSLEEIRELRKFVKNTYLQMQKDGLPTPKKYKLGIMLEIPSVIFIMQHLAKEVDFFSIGTNDLAQFMLATDRTDDSVSNYFLLHHPSILQAVKLLINQANTLKKEITVCGTMAESPMYIGFLLGCGLQRFSVQLSNYKRTVAWVTKHDLRKAKKLSEKVCSLGSSEETALVLQKYLNELPSL